jgi:hypothetical protein
MIGRSEILSLARKHIALALFFGCLASSGIAWMIISWHIPLPPCGMRLLLGLPCPLCGSTRALAALANLDLTLAFRLNPFTTAFVFGSALWLLLSFLFPYFASKPTAPVRKVRLLSLPWLGVALLVANWIYLCLTLPP